MAHNNGMVPKRGGKSRKGVSDNAAKFQAAVDAMPLGHGTVAPEEAIDPAYATVPISEFVPHRPARPEKSEGGKRFRLVSDYEPAGDQRTAIPELVLRVACVTRRSLSASTSRREHTGAPITLAAISTTRLSISSR